MATANYVLIDGVPYSPKHPLAKALSNLKRGREMQDEKAQELYAEMGLKPAKRLRQSSKNYGNDNTVGGLQNPEPEHRKVQALARSTQKQGEGSGRVVVCIISLRKRLLDFDNLVGGAKATRDSIASSLGVDDADSRVEWQYHQIISMTEGTLVVIAPI